MFLLASRFSETELLNHIQATVALGLLLLLNCCSEAVAETSAQAGITNGARPTTASDEHSQPDESEMSPAEVLLTIKGPAKVKSETKKQVGQELIEQTAQEDNSHQSLKSLSDALSPAQHHPIESSSRVPNSTSLAPSDSKKQIAQRVPNAPGEFGLSASATQLAKEWNVYSQIVALDAAYQKFNSTHSTEAAIAYLLAKQRVLADLGDLGYDVRRCTNAVDREIAKNASKAAYLTELRDKAIRFNTYADFVAGGLTGVIAGALEMADLSRFANTSVDISEGIGQMGLSAWAFKAEHAGDRRQGGLPNVLAAVVDRDYHHQAYPESVRTFLNTSEGESGPTRLDAMLNRWTKLNFCLTHSGHRTKRSQRVKHLTGTHTEDATATIDLLEDRTAMLQDLRAEVTMMDEAVAELFDLVKRY